MENKKVKVLYHGTDKEFEIFNFKRAKRFKDFGRGFYLTSDFKQAQRWAQSKSRENKKAFIYSYQMKPFNKDNWKVLELLQYNKEWVDFICKSRIEDFETDYDIIYDRIADNQYKEISDTLQKYRDNKITAQEVIQRIKWRNGAGDQYCFKTEHALELLVNRKVFIQYRDDKGVWRMERQVV